MSKREDITGKKFGHLTTIKYIKNNKHGRAIWLFECDCENKTKKELAIADIKYAGTQSCGCLHKKRAKECNTKHGLSNNRIYDIWLHMKQRCYDKNYPKYKDWGGRGIKICNEWLEEDGFKRFYEWSIKNGYQDNLTINRKNNDKDYTQTNCNWATRIEQANNRRNNHKIFYKGKMQTLAQWEKEYGLREKLLYERLSYGWSTEEALTTPVGVKR
jgi:hypothetical protein